MRRLTHEEALAEADRQEAERGSVAMRAGSFTKDMVARLERQVAFAPQLPPDAHVALAMDPNGEALMEQFVAEYSRQQPVQLTALQRRQIEAVSMKATQAISKNTKFSWQEGPNLDQSLNEQMGTRFGERNVPGEIGGFINRQVRRVPGASPVLDAGTNVARDTVRGVIPLLEVGEQFPAAVGRNIAGAVQGTNSAEWDNYWRDPINNERPNASAIGQTNLGVITDEFQSALFERRSPDVQTGTGWFVGEDSGVFTERQRREREMGTLPNGQTYTLGRQAAWGPVALGIIEPEGDAYNVISGFIDGLVAIGAPGPELFAAQGTRRASALGTELGGGVSGLSHRTGAVQGLYTQYDRNRWANTLTTRRVQPMIDMMTEASGDRGWLEIWQATRPRAGSRATSGTALTPQAVSMLVDAKSGDEVRDILFEAAEAGMRPTVRTNWGRRMDAIGRGAADRTPSFRRLWGDAPRGADPRDPTDFVTRVDDLARVIKMDSDDMSTWISRAGRAADEGERRRIWQDLWEESAVRMSADHGVNRARARQISQYMMDEVDTARASAADMIEFGDREWNLGQSSVGGQPMPGAFHLAERANFLPMVNVRELRRATSAMRPFYELSDAAASGGLVSRTITRADGSTFVRKVSPTQAVERLENLFGTAWESSVGSLLWAQSSVWKPARLFRLGYTLRVTPEEFGRRIWDGQTWVTHPAGVFSLLADRRKVDELTELLTGRSGMGRIVDETVHVDSKGRLVSKAGEGTQSFGVAAGFTDDDMRRVLVQSEVLNGMLDPYTTIRQAARGTNGRSTAGGVGTRRIQALANDGVTVNPNFVTEWEDTLMRLGSDPVVQRVARHGVDDTWRWMMRLGEEGTVGRSAQSALADAGNLGRGDLDALTRLWEGAWPGTDMSRGVMSAIDDLPISQGARDSLSRWLRMEGANPYPQQYLDELIESGASSQVQEVLREALGDTVLVRRGSLFGRTNGLDDLPAGATSTNASIIPTWMMDDVVETPFGPHTFLSDTYDEIVEGVGQGVSEDGMWLGLLPATDGAADAIRRSLVELGSDDALRFEAMLRDLSDEKVVEAFVLWDAGELPISFDTRGLESFLSSSRLEDAFSPIRSDLSDAYDIARGDLNDVSHLSQEVPVEAIIGLGGRAEGEVFVDLARMNDAPVRVADEAAELGSLPRRMLNDPLLQDENQLFWERLQAMHSDNAGNSVLSDPGGLRKYLESTDAQIRQMSGGDDQLLNVLRSGRWDKSINLTDKVSEGLSPAAIAAQAFNPGAGPGAFRKFITGFFELTVGLPANKLNHIPAFRAYYERAIVELAPLADNVDDFMRGVQKAGLRPSAIDTARRGATGEGLLSAHHIDLLARKHAADQVSELMFDATQRSNFFDQFALASPFGEAWREIVKSWAKLAGDQPFVPLRYGASLASEGSTGDAGQTYLNIMGSDKEAEGFFYVDQYGETSFMYPVSKLPFLASGLPGGGFEGALRSLNIVGEVAPSVGPVVGMPLDHVIPDTKKWDGLRNVLFPFGSPGDVTDWGLWLPTWATRAYDNTFGDDYGYSSSEAQTRIANAQMQAMRALASTGDYDLTTVEDYNRLVDDASEAATKIGLFQAFMYGTAPTSPKTFYELVGPNGENVEMAVAMDALYNLYETDPDNAIIRWVGEYGLDNILMTQGFTTTTNWGGMPLHQEGWDWYRDNKGVAEDYQQIYGLFAPGPAASENPDDFINDAYNYQLESGERARLSQREWFALAQDRVGDAIYRNVRDSYYEAAGGSLNDEQRFLLDTVEADIKEILPLWREVENPAGRTPVPALIDDFERAYSDERLTSTPAGQTFRAYWDLRRQVVADAEQRGLVSPDPDASSGWRQANAGLPYRELLREALGRMTAAEPEFGELASVLEREFKFDD